MGGVGESRPSARRMLSAPRTSASGVSSQLGRLYNSITAYRKKLSLYWLELADAPARVIPSADPLTSPTTG